MIKRILTTATLVIIISLVLSCSSKNKLDEFPTALEQFDYAALYHQMHSGKILTRDNEKVIKEIIRHYQKVVDKFPDDDISTPEAKMQIANGYYLIKDYKKALKYYNSILNNKSRFEYHYAKALKKIGDCYGIMDKSDQAVKYWTECIDKYKDSDNSTVQAVVEECKKYLGKNP